MTSRHYRLPSLHALATFEASARHRSFKRAADELNVTAGAVSRQIKALEDELGTALFDRARSGLEFTESGELLYGVLCDTFARLGDTVGTIRLGQARQQVTMACTHAFAKCWLMPRMGKFWQEHPDLYVNHLISDEGRDFKRAEVDLRIRYGFGAWHNETAVKLFDDRIYPVAAPRFAERHSGAVAADLPNLPLLHVDWVDRDWTGWDELFHRADIVHAQLTGRRFSTFDVVLEACKSGQGVAIGWDRLVCDLIASGDLVRFTDLTLPAPGAYYLTWNTGVTPKGSVAELRDWLVEEAGPATLPTNGSA